MRSRDCAQIRDGHVESNGDSATTGSGLIGVEPGHVEGMPGGRSTGEDEEGVEGPVAFGVWEGLKRVVLEDEDVWGIGRGMLTSRTMSPMSNQIAANIIGILLELILSLHHDNVNVVMIKRALFGITSKFELKVPNPKLLMIDGEYVPIGGEYSNPSRAIEQCAQTFQSVRTETTI